MKRPPNPSIEQDIKFLQSYSCDVIASYSLVPEYDPKDVAFAIDRLIGQHGELDTSARFSHYFGEGE